MNVLILGMDGYIGWSLGLHLAEKGNKVVGVDNFSRRKTVEEIGSWSATPIQSMEKRMHNAKAVYQDRLRFHEGDLNDYKFIADVLKTTKPDVIVHLGEQPSAPYSMIDVEHAAYTQQNNVIGTLNLLFAMRDCSPDAHLLKLGCYSEDTQVLTRNGWKYFYELQYEDEVCCLDPASEEIRYDKPSNIVAYPYNGKMLRIDTSNIDFLITPNHRVVYRYLGSQYKESIGTIHIATSEEVFSKNFAVPKSGNWNAEDVESFEVPSMEVRGVWGHYHTVTKQVFRMDKWLSFFGWFVAEGSVRRRNGEPTAVYLAQKSSSPKAEHLRKAVQELGLNFVESKLEDKRRPLVMSNFEISNNHLANYLAQFGTSENKFIPSGLKNVSKRQLKILFDALMLGDGHVDKKTGSMYYHSKSEHLLGDVQEIAMKLGYGATICEHLREDRGFIEKYLCISRHPNGRASSRSQSWQKYKGVVYCCSVPTGVIMVRRNGKSAFSGNTMGEYGTPPVDIPEGFFEVEHNGRKAKLMFPRYPGSFYHASKVHDTFNIMLACRIWGLRSTDVMQGVVYGTRTHEINPAENPKMCTRFDFDEVFGTAINRYCAEAVIGYPLTVYGKGGQTRGFLALVDSIQCLTLISENPPEKGEYRVFNQIDETYDVTGLANTVKKVGERKGLKISVEHVPNPRKEAEEHHYKVEAKHLRNLGFKQTRALEQEVDLMLDDLMMCKDRIKEKEQVIAPKTSWESGRYLMPSVETHSLLKEKSQESSA